ncbi:DUF3533 domain-containing protein [Paenibacillus nanensis]|uniref:DUF3533 domain-containing protein n=1 Tax=Paenibacillus nanensis TaxID=393251 RepID=A0A3A1VIE1_9BACL|nr:ABC transporter permease [Paenibacillus nanensis]RIX60025.1 DUF3533 domain-containing protein [Paenibacillus nanensis]
MQNVIKNKLLLAAPFIALLAVFIFTLTLYPSARMKPADLPVAIVNLDEGVNLPDGTKLKMGNTVSEQIRAASGGGEGAGLPVKWVEADSEQAVRDGLNDRKYYAALILPADFSAKQASLRTPEPQPAELTVLVNQGMNATVSTMLTQMVGGVADQMNRMLSAQLLAELEAKGATLTPKQAAALTSPIAVEVTNVNAFGTSAARGNAPVSLFQPIWMASIAGAAISTFVIGKTIERSNASCSGKLGARLIQLAIGVVVALFAGFGMSWLADEMLGLDVPNIGDVGLFLALAVLAFFLMISAVLSWTGIRGIVLFVLLLFFGAPLLALPPEFMNGFYRDWVHSWLPMRFMVDGLRELFFFEQGFHWSGSAAVLSGIAGVSLIVLLLSVFKPQAKQR